MSALDVIFAEHVPALLARASPSASLELKSRSTVAFAATGAESGYWIIDVARGTSRRGVLTDEPDVVIEADSATLLLMFTGGLDIQRAIAAGVVQLRGDLSALSALGPAFSLARQ